MASKLTKPRAFHEVPPGSEAAFLHPLPNKWLPGIGPKTSVRLNAAGLAEIPAGHGLPDLGTIEFVLLGPGRTLSGPAAELAEAILASGIRV